MSGRLSEGRDVKGVWREGRYEREERCGVERRGERCKVTGTTASLGPEELMEPAPRKAQQMKTSGTL